MKKPRKPAERRASAGRKTRSRRQRGDALDMTILGPHPGKFVIYSEDEERVIGVGDTEDEAYKQAHASGVRGLWHSAYSPEPGELWI